MVQQRNLPAFQLVEPAEFLGDVLDRDIGRGPVGPEQWKIVLEHRAVLGVGTAVPHRNDRDLVCSRLFGEGEGDAGRQRIDEGRASWPLALETLVTLNALVGRVTCLAFLDQNFDAVDAAVTLIDQVVIVQNAVCVGRAVHGIRSGTVGQNWNELLVLCRGRCAKRRARQGGRQYQYIACNTCHVDILLL